MITADQAKKNVDEAQKKGFDKVQSAIKSLSKQGVRYTYSDVMLLDEDVKKLKSQGFKVTLTDRQHKIEW